MGTLQLLTNTGCSALPFPWGAEQLPHTRQALLLLPLMSGPEHHGLLAPEPGQLSRSLQILSLTLPRVQPQCGVTHKAGAPQPLPVAHITCQTAWVVPGDTGELLVNTTAYKIN